MLLVKNPPASVGDTGDLGSSPGLGRSPAGWQAPWGRKESDMTEHTRTPAYMSNIGPRFELVL